MTLYEMVMAAVELGYSVHFGSPEGANGLDVIKTIEVHLIKVDDLDLIRGTERINMDTLRYAVAPEQILVGVVDELITGIDNKINESGE